MTSTETITPTLRIKAYSDQEVKVIGLIVLHMYTSQKAEKVIWQVTDTTRVPILDSLSNTNELYQ